MKYFLLLLISFSAQAYFVNLENCVTNGGADLYSSKQDCELTTKGECGEFIAGSCKEYNLVSEVKFGFPTGKKILVLDNAKKAANEADISAKNNAYKIKEDSRKAKRFELKAIDWDAVKTINDLKGIIKKHLETEE